MTGPELEHELELTARVRDTLRAVADATPLDSPPRELRPGQGRRVAWRPLALVGLSAAVVAGAIGLSTLDDDSVVRVETPPASDPAGPAVGPSPLPAAFDPATATPVFSADGEPDDVGAAYLRSRFPDHPAPGVRAERAVVDGETATIRWRTGDDSGQLASGELLLRHTVERWAVIASTTDLVDLSGLTYDGSGVRGTIRSTAGDAMFVDVLTVAGEPVHRAPNPDGHEGAAYRFGTGGGPAERELPVDIGHPNAPAVVRVHLVGGTILSVSEVRFDPAPLEPHDDLEGCVEQGTNVEKEPTPDVLHRSCAAALRGTIFASGAAGDRTWELVASDEPTGHWVTLRSRDQVGVFRLGSEGFPDGRTVEDAPYLQLGPCCAIGDFVAVAGSLHPDVSALRVRSGGEVVAHVPTHADPANRVVYAVALVPLGRTGPVDVDVEHEGRWITVVERMNLAVLGG